MEKTEHIISINPRSFEPAWNTATPEYHGEPQNHREWNRNHINDCRDITIDIGSAGFDGRASDAIKKYLQLELEKTGRGEVIKDAFVQIGVAPAHLFSALEDLAANYSVNGCNMSFRQFSRMLSPMLINRITREKILNEHLKETFEVVEHLAYRTRDKSLIVELNKYHDFSLFEHEEFPNTLTRPTLFVYPAVKGRLEEDARIAGDAHWSTTAMAALCDVLLEFKSISPEVRKSLEEQTVNRLATIAFRYMSLHRFVRIQNPLELRHTIKQVLNQQPKMRQYEIADAVDCITPKSKTVLRSVLRDMLLKNEIRMDPGNRYSDVKTKWPI